MNEPETIRSILQNTRTIAVVGLSDNENRPSYGVSHYMQARGYRIIPVNPEIESSLGEKAYPTLDAAFIALKHEGISIDLVNVFRAPAFVPEIVKDTMRLKIPAIWLQEGVCHEEAAGWAEKDGIKVVMDRCILKERAAAA
jgi:predicted CoA-binding protein